MFTKNTLILILFLIFTIFNTSAVFLLSREFFVLKKELLAFKTETQLHILEKTTEVNPQDSWIGPACFIASIVAVVLYILVLKNPPVDSFYAYLNLKSSVDQLSKNQDILSKDMTDLSKDLFDFFSSTDTKLDSIVDILKIIKDLSQFP